MLVREQGDCADRDLDPTFGIDTIAAAIEDPRIDDGRLRELCKVVAATFASDEPLDAGRARGVRTWIDLTAKNFDPRKRACFI